MSTKSTPFVPTAQNIAIANDIVKSLEHLSLVRENWEQTTFKKANESLYDLLAQCLEVFNAKFVNGTKADQHTLRQELITRLTALNVKTQKNSPTLNLFVRFVFCSDRKRAHGYSYVLNAALSHDISSTQLPSWIAQEGGIEEIKRKMVQSEKAQAQQEKRKRARETAEEMIVEANINPLATLSIEGLHSNDLNILLAMGDANGDFNVTYVLTEVSDGLYKALLKQAAKQIATQQDEEDALMAEADKLKPKQSANDEQMKKAA